MPRLDIYRLTTGELAVDCQSDALDSLATRFVTPLLSNDDLPHRIAHLHPVFDVAGQSLAMATHLAGAVPAAALVERLGSLREHEYVVQRAFDMLTASY